MELKDFEREDCKFSIPARPTVRQQMEYFSATAGAVGSQMLYRYWAGALTLIQSWNCEGMPNQKVNLDEISNPDQTAVIVWAALQVKSYMDTLENVSKN